MEKEKIRIPKNFKSYSEDIMSNCNHDINYKIADKIKNKSLYSTYTGWNFCGYVWWQNNKWFCEIWTYNSWNKTFVENTLEDIMTEVCLEYGDN